MREASPDRAPVPNLDVGDRRRDLGQDRARDLDLGGADELRVGDHCPDLEQAVRGEADRAQVLEIREQTAALNYGLDRVRFPAPVRVGTQVRAAVAVASARQKTSGVESVFTLTYEIDGGDRPACVADVIVLYP